MENVEGIGAGLKNFTGMLILSRESCYNSAS